MTTMRVSARNKRDTQTVFKFHTERPSLYIGLECANRNRRSIAAADSTRARANTILTGGMACASATSAASASSVPVVAAGDVLPTTKTTHATTKSHRSTEYSSAGDAQYQFKRGAGRCWRAAATNGASSALCSSDVASGRLRLCVVIVLHKTIVSHRVWQCVRCTARKVIQSRAATEAAYARARCRHWRTSACACSL